MQRNSWEQGVAMDAFFEQGDRDVVIALAKEAAYRRIPDGRPAMIRPDEGITDPCSVGEALIFSFRETDDKDLGDACDSLLNWALKSAPRNHNGIVYHVPNRPEFWITLFIVGSLRDGFRANMKNRRDHSGRPFLARWTDSASCRAFADRRVLTNPASRRRANPFTYC